MFSNWFSTLSLPDEVDVLLIELCFFYFHRSNVDLSVYILLIKIIDLQQRLKFQMQLKKDRREHDLGTIELTHFLVKYRNNTPF